MKRDGYFGSYLLYGAGGSGKTDWGVSAFWDVENQVEVARGKMITFGREENEFLQVPESCRQTAAGSSLRLTAPNLDDTNWLTKFKTFTKALLNQAKREHPLDVLLIDGITEFDLMFETTFADQDNKFKKWMALVDEFFGIMQRLDPIELGCHVIVTARVGVRKEDEDKSEIPLANHYPLVKGQFKEQLSSYFNNVFFLNTVPSKTEGKPAAHILHVSSMGDYQTKLQGERQWFSPKFKYPSTFSNSNFYDVQHRLENILGHEHVFPKANL